MKTGDVLKIVHICCSCIVAYMRHIGGILGISPIFRTNKKQITHVKETKYKKTEYISQIVN